MTEKQLAAQLRQMKVNTKGIICLGCEYENNCGIHGCTVIGIAAGTIERYDAALENIKSMYDAAYGVAKSVLRDVLAQFNIKAFSPDDALRMVYDFEICSTKASMIRCFNCINQNQWELISATAGPMGCTIVFRRPAIE